MFSKSANAALEIIERSGLPTPSQAAPLRWPEGVETGWEPPDRRASFFGAAGEGEGTVQTTNASEDGFARSRERRRKPKWYGIRRVLVRAQEGQLKLCNGIVVELGRFWEARLWDFIEGILGIPAYTSRGRILRIFNSMSSGDGHETAPNRGLGAVSSMRVLPKLVN